MASVQHLAHMKAEVFPVASLLLPAHARAPLRICYDFLRGADEIADHPALPAARRLEELAQLRTPHLATAPWANNFFCLCDHDVAYLPLAQHVLHAFEQDCRQQDYATLDELVTYCQDSAVPVGRMVLHACKEADVDVAAADALCCALQLLNHVRDIQKDYCQLQRIYLPKEWRTRFGVTNEMLTQNDITPPLEALISNLLGTIEDFLSTAQRLPTTLASTGLALQTRWCLALAYRWHEILKKRKHFSDRGQPVWHDAAFCFMKAVWH